MYYSSRAYACHLTPAALLADSHERQACREVVGRGGKYYDSDTPRATVKAAIELLYERGRRRSCRGIAEKARTAEPGRILKLAAQRKREREIAARERWNARVAAGKLGLSRVRREFRKAEIQSRFVGKVGSVADGALRLIAAAVGTIGEQAERDLMETDSHFEGKKSRHHFFQETTLDRLQIMPDWCEVLVTMRTYKSFGRSGFDGYEKRGGSSYQVYLIVRDTTTGECHIMRVPPKYGNSETQFFGSFNQQNEWGKRLKLRTADERRVHAAVAWTFDLKPEDYHPDRAA